MCMDRTRLLRRKQGSKFEFTPEYVSGVTRKTDFQLDSNHDHYLNPEYVDIRAH